MENRIINTNTSKQSFFTWLKETVVTLLLAAVIAMILRATVVEARLIPSTSMVPTLKVGDRIITDKIFYKLSGLNRGDIIVFNPPFESEIPFIKRLVGLPGDTVLVRDHKVFVNGVELREPYLAESPNYELGPLTIPSGKYLVLGDNRNQSFDGHAWGLLSSQSVIAKAVFRFWPLDRFGLIDRSD